MTSWRSLRSFQRVHKARAVFIIILRHSVLPPHPPARHTHSVAFCTDVTRSRSGWNCWCLQWGCWHQTVLGVVLHQHTLRVTEIPVSPRVPFMINLVTFQPWSPFPFRIRYNRGDGHTELFIPCAVPSPANWIQLFPRGTLFLLEITNR